MFRIRQYIKMFLQNVLLPVVYACFRHAPIREGSVIFADAHHTQMPFSMRRMYEEVCELERQGKCRTELRLLSACRFLQKALRDNRCPAVAFLRSDEKDRV